MTSRSRAGAKAREKARTARQQAVGAHNAWAVKVARARRSLDALKAQIPVNGASWLEGMVRYRQGLLDALIAAEPPRGR